jgi:hypothetical protein
VVSCASAGNCVAGGFYRDRSRHSQAWVASQRNGRWGTAIEVPGTANLNTGATVAEGAEVLSVSCGSAGNCMAGGSYKSLHGRLQAWVASQVNGRWGTAIVAPGTAALNAGGNGGVTSVSCASAGNCMAGGFYTDGSGLGDFQGFVASQRNGRWGTAIEVPGTAGLNGGGDAEVTSVACASAGNPGIRCQLVLTSAQTTAIQLEKTRRLNDAPSGITGPCQFEMNSFESKYAT